MTIFKRYIIWGIICFFCANVQAQNESIIDSLQSVVDRSSQDSIRLNAMLRLANELRNSDYKSASKLASKSIDLSKKLGLKAKELRAYNLLALTLENANLGLDTIIPPLDRAIALAKELRDTAFLANVINNKAITHSRVGQYQTSLKLYKEALDLSKIINDTISAIRCMNNMALIFKNRDAYDSALSLFFEALSLSEKVGKKTYEAGLLNNIGIVYGMMDQLDSALVYYNKSLEIKRIYSSKRSLVTTLSNIGEIYSEYGEYEKAEQNIGEAYEIAESIDYIFGTCLSLSKYALLYFGKKEYKKAIEKANQAIAVIDTSAYFDLQETLFDILKDSYAQTKDYEAAFTAQRLYYKALDTLEKGELKDTIQQLAIQLTLEKEKTEKAEILQRAKDAQIEIRKRNFVVLFILMISLLLLGWAITIYRSYKDRKKYSEELEETVAQRTAELKKANTELQSFNYIASHDIKEPIRNIGTYVHIIEKQLPKDQKDALAHYFDTIQRSSIRLHNLIEDIAQYSALSERKGINLEEVELNGLVSDVQKSIISILEEKNGTITYSNLPTIESSSSILFLIFKNIIENGLKFNTSENPNVQIDYTALENEHQFIFTDNGIGVCKSQHQNIFEMFKKLNNNKDYKGSGIGLAIVKMMVDKIHGSISIESIKDQGSRFTLTFPKINN